MNLTQLEVLMVIAETGSFTEAANRIGLTRSAASHAVANLETELGVTLLEREHGSIVPNTVGNCILQNVREALANIENIKQIAAKTRGLEAGKLRIGIVSSISAAVWTGILRKYRHEYPGIEVVTFEGVGHEVEDWIRSSTVDVGFVLRSTVGIDSSLIGHDEVRVLLPLDHPLGRQRSVTLEQVATEPFIVPKIACDFMEASWHGPAHIEFKRRYEASEVKTILAMVREGLGFTLLPEMLLPNPIEGFHMLSLDPPLRFNFGIGVRSDFSVSPAASMFVLSAHAWAYSNGFREESDRYDDTRQPLLESLEIPASSQSPTKSQGSIGDSGR
jgi:DNA-binding transcriptional LysR family regulator